MERGNVVVQVTASGSVRERILAALAGSDLSVADDGTGAAADIRVVAVDLSQPGSLRPVRAALGRTDGTQVIAVSPPCGSLGVRRAMRAGADSLVLEQGLQHVLEPAVRAVAAGLSVLPASARGAAARPTFSHREREVLRLAVEGHTNGEIAAALFLAESTVKTHLSTAYRKLGAGGRKDAAALILDPEEGLVDVILGRSPYHGDGEPEVAAAVG